MIGSSGSYLKVEDLKAIGIDHVFNYKNTSATEALDKWAPNGINIYVTFRNIFLIQYQLSLISLEEKYYRRLLTD